MEAYDNALKDVFFNNVTGFLFICNFWRKRYQVLVCLAYPAIRERAHPVSQNPVEPVFYNNHDQGREIFSSSSSIRVPLCPSLCLPVCLHPTIFAPMSAHYHPFPKKP